MSERLRSFVSELLENSGAVLEPIEPNGLEILAPPDVQEVLAVSELSRLGFSPELPEGAQRVGLESDWLDRLHGLIGSKGQWLHLKCNPERVIPSNPERILERAFSLENAIFRFQGVVPAWTRYLMMNFRYSALSDEKREGVFWVGLNLFNGALLDGFLDDLMAEILSFERELEREEGVDLDSSKQLPDVWEDKKIHTVVKQMLPPRIHLKLDKFLKGLNRRQGRGLDRLHDYFSEMQQELQVRMAKSKRTLTGDTLEEDLKRHQLRLESIVREYQAKVVDLRQKYAMTVSVAFIQGLIVSMPVYRFEVLIKRRKGERLLYLDWNPVVKKLETPPCEYTLTETESWMVCDDALHLVGVDAHSDCPHCGKPFCRSCHRERCPKCKKNHRVSD